MSQREAVERLFADMGKDPAVCAFAIEMSKNTCPTIRRLDEETKTEGDYGLFGIGFGPVARSKAVFGETSFHIEDVRSQKASEFNPEKVSERVTFDIDYASVAGLVDSRKPTEWAYTAPEFQKENVQ